MTTTNTATTTAINHRPSSYPSSHCTPTVISLEDVDGDTALARHITYVHKHNRNPELGFKPFEPEFIKNYVAFARRFDPEVRMRMRVVVVVVVVVVDDSRWGLAPFFSSPLLLADSAACFLVGW